MNPVQAIPTLYKGHKFRSRLEARWAVFFDALDEPWEYEREGYQLPGGWYLCDFWLRRLATWVEVKPKRLPYDSEEVRLCQQLGDATGNRVIMVFGSPEVYELGDTSTPAALISPWHDDHYAPCVCLVCGKFGFEFEGRGARICGEKCLPGSDRGHSSWDPRIRAAAEQARAWRPAEAEMPTSREDRARRRGAA